MASALLFYVGNDELVAVEDFIDVGKVLHIMKNGSGQTFALYCINTISFILISCPCCAL